MSVMSSLVGVAWLEPEESPNPAKPTYAWKVNPAVHTVFSARAEKERASHQRAKEAAASDIPYAHSQTQDKGDAVVIRPDLPQMPQVAFARSGIFHGAKSVEFTNEAPPFPCGICGKNRDFDPKRGLGLLHAHICRKCRYACETLKSSSLSLILRVIFHTSTGRGHFPGHLRQMAFSTRGGPVRRLKAVATQEKHELRARQSGRPELACLGVSHHHRSLAYAARAAKAGAEAAKRYDEAIAAAPSRIAEINAGQAQPVEPVRIGRDVELGEWVAPVQDNKYRPASRRR